MNKQFPSVSRRCKKNSGAPRDIMSHASPSSFKTRLAPTPSGYLHIGNVFSFVLTSLIAQKLKAHMHLRIDDLDAERTKPEYLEDIFNQLSWFGIKYDSGPIDTPEFIKTFSQLSKLHLYKNATQKLVSQNYLYACDCSRSLLKSKGLTVYTGICRDKNLDINNPEFNLRLRLPKNIISFEDEWLGNMSLDLAQEMGDFIIRRKGGLPSYQLVSAVDDLELGTNLFVRGQDLIPSTAAQILLKQLLSGVSNEHEKYFHHPLWTQKDGSKLSKSNDDLSIVEMRANGVKLAWFYKEFSKILTPNKPSSGSLQELLAHYELTPLKHMIIPMT